MTAQSMAKDEIPGMKHNVSYLPGDYKSETSV